MGSIFKKIGMSNQGFLKGGLAKYGLFGGLNTGKQLARVTAGGKNDVFDVGGVLQPDPVPPPKLVAPTPDDAASLAAQQRLLAQKFAGRGREGTVMAGTGSNTLG